MNVAGLRDRHQAHGGARVEAVTNDVSCVHDTERNAGLRPAGETRPGWDEYFMQIARTVATRATCPRASVGCVLTRARRILTTGYNGAPRGVAHCLDVGCLLLHDHCQRATHAEANAIVQGALHAVGVEGATAYCTHQPCTNCSKLLISAGIERIVYDHAYPDAIAAGLLAEAGVTIVAFTPQAASRPA